MKNDDYTIKDLFPLAEIKVDLEYVGSNLLRSEENLVKTLKDSSIILNKNLYNPVNITVTKWVQANIENDADKINSKN